MQVRTYTYLILQEICVYIQMIIHIVEQYVSANFYCKTQINKHILAEIR